MGFGNHPAAAGQGRDPSQRWVRRLPDEADLSAEVQEDEGGRDVRCL
jgi:hypothetical protein